MVDHKKGSYILILKMPIACEIAVGSLGDISFNVGWYAYVGSAMNGFERRLPHYLCKIKKSHWHIDYLLQIASINKIITLESESRIECNIARALIERYQNVSSFGCSDCACQSHLFFADNLWELQSRIKHIKKNLFCPQKKRDLKQSWIIATNDCI